jgi:glycosyltransferase involved in cell wall biosynthesis
LVVSALVPYKRLDVAIDASRTVGLPLRIVGSGPEEERLRQYSSGASVEFLGWRSNEEIRALYQQTTAVLLPGVEDFGIVPVEAQACGTPVVALAEGGARETVVDGVTGALVADCSAAAFADGIRRLTAAPLDRDQIRANAERFSREAFKQAFTAAVQEAVAAHERRPS